MQPLISIILPAYNSQATISRAIDSVSRQRFPNWELIIVNDGSTDNTLQIAEKFAYQDERIRVISQPNRGRSAARNAGLRAACAGYISFLDADDTYFSNTLQDLYDVLSSTKADLVIGEIHGHKRYKKNLLQNVHYTGKNLVSSLLNLSKNQIIFNSVCNKLFRTDIIRHNDISFPSDLEMGEDLVFVLQYILHISSYCTCAQAIYSYTCNPQSITHSTYEKHFIDRHHLAANLWIAFYKRWKLPLAPVYGSFFNYRMFGCAQLGVIGNFTLLNQVVKDTFADEQICHFANQLKQTAYDNLFAKLIRHKQIKLWTFLAWCLGITKRIKKVIIS